MDELRMEQVCTGLDLLELHYRTEGDGVILGFGGPAAFIVRIGVDDSTLQLWAAGTETHPTGSFGQLLADVNQVAATHHGPQSCVIGTDEAGQTALVVAFDQRLVLPVAPTMVVAAAVDRFIEGVATCLGALNCLTSAWAEAEQATEAIEAFLARAAADKTGSPE